MRQSGRHFLQIPGTCVMPDRVHKAIAIIELGLHAEGIPYNTNGIQAAIELLQD